MKKRILNSLLVVCMVISLLNTINLNASAASEKDTIVKGEYECTWGYYYVEKSNYNIWYISELGNYSQKRNVYSLGAMNPSASWLTVGEAAARLNSNMDRITVDYGLSSNKDRYVYDLGNKKTVYYPQIIEDRECIEGETVDIAWYFFKVPQTSCWYIVNDSEVYRFSSKNNEYDWVKIDIDGYEPDFEIKNGKMYVSFEGKNSNTPPRLTGYSSMPSQISYGKRYDLKGQIVSDSPITKVTINVFKTDGSWKDSQSVKPNSYTYDLSIINEDLHFARYPAGEMEIQIWAVNASGAWPLIGETNGNKQIIGETFKIVGNYNSGKQLIDIAAEEIGYQGRNSEGEGRGDYTKYGLFTGTNGQQWCASFVSWCVNQAGLSTKIIPKTASCNYMKKNSVSYNNWNYDSIKYINENDIIFFSSDGTQDSHHVGIVYSVNNNKITLIEGNTGTDVVKKNTYTIENLSSGKIYNGKDNWKYFCGFISVE